MPTGRAVEITRTELCATELRRAAARSRDADAARRMLALALVLEGKSRREAAETCGMDRQTLRDWVVRYNAEGLAGLSDRVPPGPAFRLTQEQMATLAGIVEAGPDPAVDHVVRLSGGWTWAAGSVSASGANSTSARWANSFIASALLDCRSGPSTPSPTRPRRRSGEKSFATLAREVLPEDARDKPIEVWFAE